MNILTLDFETFFSDEYTLKKMTTEAYVRDPRFEALMIGYRLPQGELGWVPHEQIPTFLNQFDWNTTAVLAHHAQFDGLILSHHYGVCPNVWLCSLSMARLMVGNHISVGLESLARHYGLAPKSVPYERFRGKRVADIDPVLYRELGNGCVHDVELCFTIFGKLMRGER